MDVISRIDHLNEIIRDNKKKLKTSGFIPTMGALHEGHFSLVSRSVNENDISICSIFVNPLQFNNHNDLNKYPRDLDRDIEQLEKLDCDIVFAPDSGAFYREKPKIELNFGPLGNVLEGHYRPGHFNGVAIVVSRLLHLVEPDKAYFGLKDLQQYYIVRQMCLDLGIKAEIVPCEIVRESDGLAMSSRNRRLSKKDRAIAPLIYKSLKAIKSEIIKSAEFKSELKSQIEFDLQKNNIKPEYLELVSLPDFGLNPVLKKGNDYALCIAVMLSDIRLIDNIRFQL